MTSLALWFEDNINVRTNSVTTTGGGGNPAYNAVLKAVFSNEGAEPVTLDEAKNWCRIDVSDDDDLVEETIIPAARQICEDYANMSFIERTVTATLINGLGGITLPYGPVNGSVAYTLNDTDLTALENFDITLGYGSQIVATYEAGYAVDDLPKKYKTAILNQIAWIYENRGDVALGSQISPLSALVLNSVRIDT